MIVSPGAIIHFQDSEYSSRKTGITLEPGGKITIDGATLTGIGIAGMQGGAQNGEPSTVGVVYNTPWDGISVGTTFGINQGTDCQIVQKNMI